MRTTLTLKAKATRPQVPAAEDIQRDVRWGGMPFEKGIALAKASGYDGLARSLENEQRWREKKLCERLRVNLLARLSEGMLTEAEALRHAEFSGIATSAFKRHMGISTTPTTLTAAEHKRRMAAIRAAA